HVRRLHIQRRSALDATSSDHASGWPMTHSSAHIFSAMMARRALTAMALCLATAMMSPAQAQQPYPQSGYGGQPGSNPMCQRLEAQLAMHDRNSGEAGNAQQVRRFEADAGRLQNELGRLSQQARNMGCD